MAAVSSPIPTATIPHEHLQRSDSQASADSTTSHSSRGRTTNRSSENPEEPMDGRYAPDDARGMSPRRSAPECGALEDATRAAVRQHARQMQLDLLEIAESIELVRADHDKLEKQNLALQDYIGNLTRSVGREAPKKKAGKKGRS